MRDGQLIDLRLQPGSTGGFGYGFTQAPAGSGPGRIQPGSAWNFEYGVRDQGSNGLDLSNASQVTLPP